MALPVSVFIDINKEGAIDINKDGAAICCIPSFMIAPYLSILASLYKYYPTRSLPVLYLLDA